MIFEKQVVDVYRAMAYTRCDDMGTAYYFSAEDFPGLLCKEYPFFASAGHELKGYIYSYEGAREDKLIVFDHGFGGGHRSYMKEIELLCKNGYTVFAYDHTGCMESGGESANGMAQSLCDLNDCISTIKADGSLSGKEISVIGHSWGGFSTLNITALHPDIARAVVFSGFVSVQLLINSYFSGILSGYRRAIMELERSANPDFVDFDAVKTLSETKARVLLIYSDNDKRCKKAPHYDTLYKALSDKENISFLMTHNKGHNPNYTEDAVTYLESYVKELSRKQKRGELATEKQRREFVASYDWNRMTAQDGAVWDTVLAMLEE